MRSRPTRNLEEGSSAELRNLEEMVRERFGFGFGVGLQLSVLVFEFDVFAKLHIYLIRKFKFSLVNTSSND